MPEKKQEYLPFHAINEFMRDDYRIQVVRNAFHALPQLPPEYKEAIDKQTKRVVKVPGFRNSSLAPLGVRIQPTANAFEKSADMVSAILAAWSEAQLDLRLQVYELLTERGWTLLPLDVNRSKLPGFLLQWPKGEDFESIVKAFQEKYPESVVSSDDISLMTVWLGDRLPYNVDGEEETDSMPEPA